MIIWLVIFMAMAILAQFLWARMVQKLREHRIQYEGSAYNLDALREYQRLVRQPLVGADERRLLLWVYLSMALTWAAFLGLLVSAVTDL